MSVLSDFAHVRFSVMISKLVKHQTALSYLVSCAAFRSFSPRRPWI